MELQNANAPVIPGINLAKNKDKVSLFAFGLVQKSEPRIKTIGEQEIKVWPTIPYEDVLDAIQWSINYILDDRTFISAPLNAIIGDIAICRYWSNIDCSEVDSVDFDANRCYEFYDALNHFNIIDTVLEVATEKQIAFFRNNLKDTLDSLVAYRNSAAGLIEAIHARNNEEQGSLDSVLKTINDDDQMEMVRKMMRLIESEQNAVPSEASQEGATPSE